MNSKSFFVSNAGPVLAKTILVGSVAALFGCASNAPAKAPSGTAAATVRCQGINECRGKGTCAGNGHPCGRHTPCKGQGWLSVSSEECASKGGTVL